MFLVVLGAPSPQPAHAVLNTSSLYYYARLRVEQPAAARRAASSLWSANGAFDTTETSSAPRDSNARSAAPSSTVQTRTWRGARRQGCGGGGEEEAGARARRRGPQELEVPRVGRLQLRGAVGDARVSLAFVLRVATVTA